MKPVPLGMTRSDLIKKLIPGFIPLFVFIAADAIWGTQTGLYIAVGAGIGQLLWIALKERRFDKFVLFDTILVVLFGAVSIILENDLFFKLKPGFIELILVAILAFSGFTKVNIIGMLGERYLKGAPIHSGHMAQMRRALRRLFYIFSIHTLLVFYSAFYMSNEAW